MKRLAWVLALAVMGCGGKSPPPKGPTVTTLPPANPVAVAKMAQAVQAARDADGRSRAIALLREAIAQDPNFWEAHFNLGVLLAQSGDLEKAEAELVSARKLAPDAEDVVIALGEVKRLRGDNRGAAEALVPFIEGHPSALQARHLLVVTLREGKESDRAIGQARELLAKRPGDPATLSELSLCHLAKGERETARLLARQAIEVGPKSAHAHRALGLALLTEGDDAAAFQSFLKAAQVDPKDTTARLNMGVVLLRAGAYARAEEQYRAILKIVPDDIDAHMGLAAALRGQTGQTGQTGQAGQAGESGNAKLDEARTLLTKVIEREPHEWHALFNLGVLYADFLKMPEKAKPMFSRFMSEAPSDHPARAEAERYLTMLKGK